MANDTNTTPSYLCDSPMTIFIRRQKNPIYMRLRICFYRPWIRVRVQRIKIITFLPPFHSMNRFLMFQTPHIWQILKENLAAIYPCDYVDYSTDGIALSTS